MKTPITEELGVHKEWKEMAKTVDTPEKLADFARGLIDRYEHDYGTIVHAMAALMIASFNVMNKSDQGGITGFQASCLGWEMIQEYFGKSEVSKRLTNYDHLLYPQYKFEFTTISKDVWEKLQAVAKEKLNDNRGSDDVKAHWRQIIEGAVPFGLTIEEKEE